MVDRKASQVYVVDDVAVDGDAVTWDASLRQWAPRATGGASPTTLSRLLLIAADVVGIESGVQSNPAWTSVVEQVGTDIVLTNPAIVTINVDGVYAVTAAFNLYGDSGDLIDGNVFCIPNAYGPGPQLAAAAVLGGGGLFNGPTSVTYFIPAGTFISGQVQGHTTSGTWGYSAQLGVQRVA